MTQAEAHQRVEKAQNLRVFKVNDTFYVESSEGKICYNVTMDTDKGVVCTCGDYARNIKSDPNFRCKHILAAIQCNGGDLLTTEYLEKKKPKLDERFIKNIKGKDFVVYIGLLDLAHQLGLAELKAIPVQYPSKDNDMRAICTSYAKTFDGRVFEDVGDADPRNTDTVISKHIIRMASTRAKARVLRDLTNVGMTCLEELASLEEDAGNEPLPNSETKRNLRSAKKEEPQKEAAVATSSAPSTTSAPAAPSNVTEQSSNTVEQSQTSEQSNATTSQQSPPSNGPKISDAQRRAVLNLCRRRGLSEEDLAKRVQDQYKVPLDSLSGKDAAAFIKTLQLAA
jgi:hypothetical protein